MQLNIRDPRAQELARELAEAEGKTLTEVVVGALEREVQRLRKKPGLSLKAREIAESLARKTPGGGHKMTKKEIDEMWGA
jgi:antitoxin VapB